MQDGIASVLQGILYSTLNVYLGYLAERAGDLVLAKKKRYLMELRRANTRLLGTVGFFPEKYGARLIRPAANLFHAKSVSPAMYTPHRLITSQTVDQYYPNDVLMSDSDLELLLLRAP